jgi:cysteine desulfurase
MSVYLDHAASTPLRAEAKSAWMDASDVAGNASSVHADGQAARRLLESAREQVASTLGCEPIEVLFTSGGTESINTAVKGLWWSRVDGADSIVLPDGEHHATMDAVQWLHGAEAATVRRVRLTPTGAVDTDDFLRALPGAALATTLVANNEIGTVSDVTTLAAAAREAGTALHIDAVGAVGVIDVDFGRWRGSSRSPAGLVAMSLSGHKVGAPVGTGALIVSRHARLQPLVHGGGQQRGLRAGTQDVAGAAALAAALVAAHAERDVTARRLCTLRDRAIAGIRAAVPAAELLGDPVERLPGNVHFHFPGAAGETLLFLLDQQGISVSTGSACQAGVTEPSHVVLALGRDDRTARSVLRITLGRTSSATDVDAVVAALPAAYRRAVAAGSR